MKNYQAAIIGCGRIGSEFDQKISKHFAYSHAGAYLLHPKTELIAACDINKGKLSAFKRKWKIKSTYMDYKEMLKNEKIDILSICTSPETHWEIVRYASKFPIRAIYCEKPITEDTKDARDMIQLCKRKKILLVINHQRRFGKFYQELQNKILRGAFGDIQQVSCYYARGIYNTGTHIFDLFCFLFGNPEWVIAFFSRNKSPFKNDPNLDGIIKFRNGFMSTIKGCDDSDYLIFEVDILTTKLRLRLGGNDIEYFQAKKSKNPLKRKELFQARSVPFKYSYTPVSLAEGVSHIIACLEKKQKSISSGEDALLALKIIKAMLTSAKNSGRKIYIK